MSGFHPDFVERRFRAIFVASKTGSRQEHLKLTVADFRDALQVSLTGIALRVKSWVGLPARIIHFPIAK